MNGFKAQFIQTINNPSAGLEEELEGNITVKGKRYKLDLLETQIFVNEDERWIYNAEFNEVMVVDVIPEEDEITPGNIFDLYKDGFKYVLMSEMANGDRVIELSPESLDKTYHKIRLIVDSRDALKSFTIFEKTGTQYGYQINDFQEMSSLTDGFFNFDPSMYDGIRVEDFRSN